MAGSKTTDKKIVKLAIIFFCVFALISLLTVFKTRHSYSSAVALESEDYIVLEKSERWKDAGGATCAPNKACEYNLKVYKSGKVVSLGSKMFVDTLSRAEMEDLIESISKVDLLADECIQDNKTEYQKYTLKLGTQVKKSSLIGCKINLGQIESQMLK